MDDVVEIHVGVVVETLGHLVERLPGHGHREIATPLDGLQEPFRKLLLDTLSYGMHLKTRDA